MSVPTSLDDEITALAPEVDGELRVELQTTLATLRHAHNATGVLIYLSRVTLLLMRRLFEAAGQAAPSDNLYACIEQAYKQKLLPKEIYSSLHTIRTWSNPADHAAERVTLNPARAERQLAALLDVIEWFYCEWEQGPGLETIYRAESIQPVAPPPISQTFLARSKALPERGRLRKWLFLMAAVALLSLTLYWLFPYVHINRGASCFRNGDTGCASAAYRKALNTMRGPLRWWMQDDVSYRFLLAQGYHAWMQEAWPEAERFFMELQQQKDPRRKSQGYAGLAAVALARDDSPSAHRFVQQAEAYDRKNLFAHLVRGRIAFYEGDLTKAVQAYQTALSQTDGLRWQQAVVSHHLLLAQGYQAWMQKAWPEAERFFKKLQQQQDPRRKSQGYAGLAAVALARGDLKGAHGFGQEAERYDQENVFAQIVRGRIFFYEFLHGVQDKTDKAEEAYEAALDPNKTRSPPWLRAIAAHRLGRLYAAQHMNALDYYHIALEAYEKVPAFRHEMALVYANRAYLLAQMGEMEAYDSEKTSKFQAALDDYTEAIRRNPDDHLIKTLRDGVKLWQQYALDEPSVEEMLVQPNKCWKISDHDERSMVAPLSLAIYTFDRHGSFDDRAGVGDVILYRTLRLLKESGSIRIHDRAIQDNCFVVRLLLVGEMTPSRRGSVYQDEIRMRLIDTKAPDLAFATKHAWKPGHFHNIDQELAADLLQHIRQAYPRRLGNEVQRP